MRRFDRHIATSFALAFASTLALIVALFVVVDIIQELDRVVVLFGRDGVLVGFGVLVRYYAARFLSQFTSFGEIVAVAPAVLVASSMARANEFVGMMAGGTSLRRVALPLFVGCAVLGLLTFGLRNVAGPAFVRSEHADLRRIRGEEKTLGRSLSVQGRDGRVGARASRAVVLSLEEFEPSTSSGRGFAAQVIEPGEPLVDIRAPAAVWDEDAHEWRFPEGATKWLYGASPFAGATGDMEARKALERTEAFGTVLGPDLLEAEELGVKVLTLGGLWRQRARHRFAAELHERMAQLFVPLVMALTALPLVLTADRSRVLQGTVLAILAVAAYEVIARAMLSAAGSGLLPAFLGGWLPPLAFAGFGAWRMAKLRT
jgi:lipopolysaccharide export system permease protein